MSPSGRTAANRPGLDDHEIVRILRCLAGLAAVLFVAVLPSSGPAAAAPPDGLHCPETRANLAGQRITATEKLPDLTCADLHGAIFDRLDLVQVSMEGADAHGASFQHTRLTQAHFSGADLRDANFDHADLGQAYFDGADARGANFGHADLTQADLSEADLRGADLLHARLIQADLSEADLRGAKTWWAESIDADLSEARVDFIDPRTFQFGLLLLAPGLVLLVRAILATLRGRALPATLRGRFRPSGFTGAAIPALGVLVIGGFVVFMGKMLFPLLFVTAWLPLLGAAGLALLGGLIRRYAPPRIPPEPSPFDALTGV
jgi:uncharacterized protein YjbI with pentapeptide repeats